MTKKYTFSNELISDLHKDAWGHRPRQMFFLKWEKANDDKKQSMWDNLIDDMVNNDKAEAHKKLFKTAGVA